jgi:hypothetical protein
MQRAFGHLILVKRRLSVSNFVNCSDSLAGVAAPNFLHLLTWALGGVRAIPFLAVPSAAYGFDIVSHQSLSNAVFDLVSVALLFEQARTSAAFHQTFLVAVIGPLAAVLADRLLIPAPRVGAEAVGVFVTVNVRVAALADTDAHLFLAP